LIGFLATGRGYLPSYDSTVAAVTVAAGQARHNQAVECVRHGGPRNSGPMSKNSHWDWFWINIVEENKDGKLEVA
jgi:hypothetical protein